MFFIAAHDLIVSTLLSLDQRPQEHIPTYIITIDSRWVSGFDLGRIGNLVKFQFGQLSVAKVCKHGLQSSLFLGAKLWGMGAGEVGEKLCVRTLEEGQVVVNPFHTGFFLLFKPGWGVPVAPNK